MPAKLSTHVLDLVHGCPARGMRVELWQRAGAELKLLTTVTTNADGRTDKPLLTAEEMQPGNYELVFYVGDYFAAQMADADRIPFLDRVPVRFGISDVTASYHVPLLCSPYAYCTYRGS